MSVCVTNEMTIITPCVIVVHIHTEDAHKMLPTVWYRVSAQPRLPIIPLPGLSLCAMLRLKYSLKLTPTPGFHQSCYSFGLCMTANPESGCLEAYMVLGTVALWTTLIGGGVGCYDRTNNDSYHYCAGFWTKTPSSPFIGEEQSPTEVMCCSSFFL